MRHDPFLVILSQTSYQLQQFLPLLLAGIVPTSLFHTQVNENERDIPSNPREEMASSNTESQ